MKPEKVALRYVGKEQTIHAEERAAARRATTRMLSDAAFGGTWCGAKQPGRRYGPAPASLPRHGHAEPMPGGRRLTNYSRQRGKEWIRPTARQKRRIEKKWRHAASRGMPWAFEHLTADVARRDAVHAAFTAPATS